MNCFISGTFVVAVVGVALCCIIAVVGVGFVLHRPVSCPGSSSPLSDSSPTFHSAKLAFSSRSPEDKISNSKLSKYEKIRILLSTDNSIFSFSLQNIILLFLRADTRNLKRKSAEEPEKSSSRAFKFRENTDNNNQGQMYNYKGQVHFILSLTLSVQSDFIAAIFARRVLLTLTALKRMKTSFTSVLAWPHTERWR